MSTAIDVQSVTKAFDKTRAVDEVTFSVPKGGIYGLLGPNGAGKTTTLRMINYIIVPDTGRVLIEGHKASHTTQEWIGYLPEERGLYKKMKVGEQLMYLGQLKGLSRKDAQKQIKYWLERFDAKDWLQKEVGELSKGMHQKIQFISTILHDPQICIFDEPFSGLDPINSEILKKVILELKDAGKTILFATHRMEQVEQMCDHICLFNQGKVVLEGKLDDIRRSFGKNTIELQFQGDGAFLDKLEGVRINNRSNNFAELRLLDNIDDQTILKEAMNHARIERYELVMPSLNEIFITTVGKKPEEITDSREVAHELQ